MEKAAYPKRQCREGVYSPHGLAYPCEVVDQHPGPCASFSVAASVKIRDAWEKKNENWEARIGKEIEA